MMKYTVSEKTKDKFGRNEWITLKSFTSKSKAMAFAKKQSKKALEIDVRGFDSDYELTFHTFISNGKQNNMGV